MGRTAVSIAEITERAGVGFGSFHNHFDSKDALFEAAVEASRVAWSDTLAVLVGELTDPAEVFAAGFRLTGRMQRRMPEVVRVLLHRGTSLLVTDAGLAPLAAAHLAAGAEAGRFDLDEAEFGVMTIGGALLGMLQYLDLHPEVDDAVVADRFTVRVLVALGLDRAEASELVTRPLPTLP